MGSLECLLLVGSVWAPTIQKRRSSNALDQATFAQSTLRHTRGFVSLVHRSFIDTTISLKRNTSMFAFFLISISTVTESRRSATRGSGYKVGALPMQRTPLKKHNFSRCTPKKKKKTLSREYDTLREVGHTLNAPTPLGASHFCACDTPEQGPTQGPTHTRTTAVH